MSASSLGWARWSGPPTISLARFGQDPAPTPVVQDPNAGFTVEDLKRGLKAVTPTLLIVGIATGAAFAIGSGLVAHYLFAHGARGRGRR